MGVPAHDERDFEFSLKYGLPIKQVIEVGGRRAGIHRSANGMPGTANTAPLIHSGEYDGLDLPAGHRRHRRGDLKAKGWGDKRVQWRLRDWGISRQRYWGCPIPLIHCPNCEVVPVPEARPAGGAARGPGARWQRQPLNKTPSFLECKCPKCGGAGAARDGHDGYLRGLVVVLPALRLPRRTTRRWSMSAPTTGRRWISTSAASSTRSCTCCMRVSGRA